MFSRFRMNPMVPFLIFSLLLPPPAWADGTSKKCALNLVEFAALSELPEIQSQLGSTPVEEKSGGKKRGVLSLEGAAPQESTAKPQSPSLAEAVKRGKNLLALYDAKLYPQNPRVRLDPPSNKIEELSNSGTFLGDTVPLKVQRRMAEVAAENRLNREELQERLFRSEQRLEAAAKANKQRYVPAEMVGAVKVLERMAANYMDPEPAVQYVGSNWQNYATIFGESVLVDEAQMRLFKAVVEIVLLNAVPANLKVTPVTNEVSLLQKNESLSFFDAQEELYARVKLNSLTYLSDETVGVFRALSDPSTPYLEKHPELSTRLRSLLDDEQKAEEKLKKARRDFAKAFASANLLYGILMRLNCASNRSGVDPISPLWALLNIQLDGHVRDLILGAHGNACSTAIDPFTGDNLKFEGDPYQLLDQWRSRIVDPILFRMVYEPELVREILLQAEPDGLEALLKELDPQEYAVYLQGWESRWRKATLWVSDRIKGISKTKALGGAASAAGVIGDILKEVASISEDELADGNEELLGTRIILPSNIPTKITRDLLDTPWLDRERTKVETANNKKEAKGKPTQPWKDPLAFMVTEQTLAQKKMVSGKAAPKLTSESVTHEQNNDAAIAQDNKDESANPVGVTRQETASSEAKLTTQQGKSFKPKKLPIHDRDSYSFLSRVLGVLDKQASVIYSEATQIRRDQIKQALKCKNGGDAKCTAATLFQMKVDALRTLEPQRRELIEAFIDVLNGLQASYLDHNLTVEEADQRALESMIFLLRKHEDLRAFLRINARNDDRLAVLVNELRIAIVRPVFDRDRNRRLTGEYKTKDDKATQGSINHSRMKIGLYVTAVLAALTTTGALYLYFGEGVRDLLPSLFQSLPDVPKAIGG